MQKALFCLYLYVCFFTNNQIVENMKQKIVMRVHMHCDKCRKKALEISATRSGVSSVSLDGDDKEKVIVTGDEVDTIKLAELLRKKVGHTDILIVEEVKAKDEKKKEEKKEEEFQWMKYQYQYQYPQMMTYQTYDPPNRSCTIM